MIKLHSIIVKISFAWFLFCFTFLLSRNSSSQIGPEIPIDGLNGYYDHQTNGACPHYLYYVNATILHAIYLSSFDSVNYLTSRRTKYSFSDDAGSNWVYIGEAPPSTLSSFPTLTAGTAGASQEVAILANTIPSGVCMHVDLIPGGGTFTSTPELSPKHTGPIIQTLTNGNVIVSSKTSSGDTGFVQLFNANTNSWGISKSFLSSATSHSGMRYTIASGPAGKALYVISAMSDQGGPAGGNRIFYWTSTNNGLNWSNQYILFQSYIDPSGDTVRAWSGIDAIYDQIGNFYVAFNTIADSIQTAKIWVSKNGGTPSLVASNMQITGSAKSFTTPLAQVCSMDWPSLSITADGGFIVCAYSVLKQNDIVNGFQAFDIYFNYSSTFVLNFQNSPPYQVTSGTKDERYISLNKVTIGNYPYVVQMVYQKDPQPGSAVLDSALVSKASLIYRRVLRNFYDGLKQISGEIPVGFSLYQNYPNPFNPVTKIKFSLPHSPEGGAEAVRVVVFDILGREIAALVNEHLKPGTYEVEWDGTNHPSGVYFYKLDAGEFMETKRMVLVK